jgi:hypothetical protein
MINRNVFKAVLVPLMLITLGGCDGGQNTAISPPETTLHPPKITLGPESSEYTRDEVFKSTVQFAVAVENKNTGPITFAHPAICFPEKHQIGESLDLRVRHGKSEILLTVRRPDGSEIVLRDAPHFFGPDNVSHFFIDPGESGLFFIGWFFQNAQGGWENDISPRDVFTGRGEYRLKLLYRNIFPKALIHDTATGRSRYTDVWTGEIRSNEVTVTIQ